MGDSLQFSEHWERVSRPCEANLNGGCGHNHRVGGILGAFDCDLQVQAYGAGEEEGQGVGGTSYGSWPHPLRHKDLVAEALSPGSGSPRAVLEEFCNSGAEAIERRTRVILLIPPCWMETASKRDHRASSYSRSSSTQ